MGKGKKNQRINHNNMGIKKKKKNKSKVSIHPSYGNRVLNLKDTALYRSISDSISRYINK